MNDVTPETWIPIAGYEGLYEVSDLGRVRALPCPTCGNRKASIMRGSTTRYPTVQLAIHRVKQARLVHRLVAAAFIGPCPDGQEVRHLDGNRRNNTLANLAYGTHDENMADQIAHGTRPAGTKHYRSKLNETEIADIRAAWAQGERPCDLADRYGVSRPTISRIVYGMAYLDVEASEAPLVACRFPGCGVSLGDQLRVQGRRPGFCADPGHNRMSAKRERLRLARLERDEAARCVYPGCMEPTAKTVYPEKPLKYCVKPEHNYETAKCARRRNKTKAV